MNTIHSKVLLLLLLSIIMIVACASDDEFIQQEILSVNGTELFVNIMGEGEPLIVLHGGPGLSHDYFLPHLEPLSNHMKLILFDQRGMGRSSVDLDSTSFSMELIIEDIEALRQKLGLNSIHLMGHSWGGIVAMHYAVNYPQNLSSLILCNSMPASPDFDEQLGKNFQQTFERQNMEDLEPLQKKIDAGNRDIAVQERYVQLHFRPSFYDTSDVNKLQLNLSDSFFKTEELLPYLASHEEPRSLIPELKSVHVPALIIRGEIEVIPVESDRKLEEILKNGKLISIDKAGHFPFVEKPEEFRELIINFVKSETES